MRALLLIVALGVALAAAESETYVTAGTAVSETVCALGAEDRIVAVDLTSTWPEGLAERKPVVGYLRALPAEGLLATGAGCLLTTDDAGPTAVLEQIAAAGMRVERLPVSWEPDAAIARIRRIGAVIGKAEAAEDLAAALEAELRALAAVVPDPADGPSALYVLHPRSGSAMVAGSSTSAAALLALAGCRNAAAEISGWKPMNGEAIVAADPELLVVDADELERVGGIDGLLELPGIALTTAGRERRVLVADHGLLLSFGPRLGQAIRSVATIAHPGLELP